MRFTPPVRPSVPVGKAAPHAAFPHAGFHLSAAWPPLAGPAHVAGVGGAGAAARAARRGRAALPARRGRGAAEPAHLVSAGQRDPRRDLVHIALALAPFARRATHAPSAVKGWAGPLARCRGPANARSPPCTRRHGPAETRCTLTRALTSACAPALERACAQVRVRSHAVAAKGRRQLGARCAAQGHLAVPQVRACTHGAPTGHVSSLPEPQTLSPKP